MTRKHRGVQPAQKPKTPCPRCGSTERAKDGADLACGNCNALLIKDHFRR